MLEASYGIVLFSHIGMIAVIFHLIWLPSTKINYMLKYIPMPNVLIENAQRIILFLRGCSFIALEPSGVLSYVSLKHQFCLIYFYLKICCIVQMICSRNKAFLLLSFTVFCVCVYIVHYIKKCLTILSCIVMPVCHLYEWVTESLIQVIHSKCRFIEEQVIVLMSESLNHSFNRFNQKHCFIQEKKLHLFGTLRSKFRQSNLRYFV